MPDDSVNENAPQLADGSAPLSPGELLRRLEELGIQSRTSMHEAVFTVEEARKVRAGHEEGAHIKNLFLRNKKGTMWLVTCLEDRDIDLKSLGAQLGAGRLSFGSAERLMRYLGVTPGSVTPLAAINDHGGEVKVVVDKAVLELAPVHAHPLANDMTTSMAPEDLVRFLEAVDHAPEILDFEAP